MQYKYLVQEGSFGSPNVQTIFPGLVSLLFTPTLCLCACRFSARRTLWSAGEGPGTVIPVSHAPPAENMRWIDTVASYLPSLIVNHLINR